ncbi:hypothetical protein E2C01_074515 [Portunus trituberculatus]|uniref:Uncharacterized protein n=1 Tax=Portunus trituberculatus TaxID=210409 RepID=A0A5B7ICN9_PORTR|nr:hypothetical protein [Portunus trituberculatus]
MEGMRVLFLNSLFFTLESPSCVRSEAAAGDGPRRWPLGAASIFLTISWRWMVVVVEVVVVVVVVVVARHSTQTVSHSKSRKRRTEGATGAIDKGREKEATEHLNILFHQPSSYLTFHRQIRRGVAATRQRGGGGGNHETPPLSLPRSAPPEDRATMEQGGRGGCDLYDRLSFAGGLTGRLE